MFRPYNIIIKVVYRVCICVNYFFVLRVSDEFNARVKTVCEFQERFSHLIFSNPTILCVIQYDILMFELVPKRLNHNNKNKRQLQIIQLGIYLYKWELYKDQNEIDRIELDIEQFYTNF